MVRINVILYISLCVHFFSRVRPNLWMKKLNNGILLNDLKWIKPKKRLRFFAFLHFSLFLCRSLDNLPKNFRHRNKPEVSQNKLIYWLIYWIVLEHICSALNVQTNNKNKKKNEKKKQDDFCVFVLEVALLLFLVRSYSSLCLSKE